MNGPSDAGKRPKNPLDQLFEVFVYAPLGFVLDARQLFPKFVDRGRSQVVLARVVGKYTVQHGQKRAGRYLGDSQTQVAAVFQALGLLPEDQEPSDDGDVAAFEAGEVTFADDPVLDDGTSIDATPGSAEGTRSGELPTDPVLAAVTDAEIEEAPVEALDPADLAIPDYDNLSASQVVPRLGGLAPDELEAVRRYELAARGRKTILGKITQLQSA